MNIQLIQNNDYVIGINTISVYSRIAQLGRKPNKQAERKMLIKHLANAMIKTTINGKVILKDPPFVAMSTEDFEKCFGNPARLPQRQILYLSKTE